MDYTVTVSVLMATYNTEIPMLKEAVDSILNQTFRDFEFLIVDDGSTNGSDAYLKSIADERVRILWNPKNIGVTKSLNIALKEAKGKYVARMDADDLSLPERFAKQVAFMDARPDVILCGTRIAMIDEDGNITQSKAKDPKTMDEYRVRLLFSNPGPSHPSAMMRHETLQKNGILYDENLTYAQDYGMWETLSRYGTIETIQEALVYRRMHKGQISKARRPVQMQCDKMTQRKLLTALIPDVTDAEADLHYMYSGGYYPNAVITPEITNWYDRLQKANESRKLYNAQILRDRILTIKKNLIRQSIKLGGSRLAACRQCFRYLSFADAVRAALGILKEKEF